ncbi:MAG: hypothetical protein U0Z53_14475 [Blastocatellia bacterium]
MKLRIPAVLLISLLLIFAATPVSAQIRNQKSHVPLRDWERVRQIPFDVELTVETRNGNAISGWMKEATDMTLSVSNYRRVTEIPRLTIKRIFVKGHVSLPEAAGAGLTAGSSIGYRAGRTDCYGGSLKGAAIGAGVGAILGAIIGSGKPKSTLVYEAELSVLPVFPYFLYW